MKPNSLFIAGNPQSINVLNFRSLVGDYFSQTYLSPYVDYSFKRFFSALKATKKALKEAKPEMIVLYQLNLTAFITLLANSGKAKVLAVGVGSDVLLMPRRNLALKLMLKYILRHSDYFNAGNDYLASEMRQYTPKDTEIMVANLGITPIKPSEKQNIIYSNRLHGDLYRVDKIIKAFAQFVQQSQYSDWKLIVAGSGKEKEFADLVSRLGIVDRVEITGWLTPEQNAENYAKSRIYVSIPISDGVPASLMEAISADCIPILSPIEAYRSLCASGMGGNILTDKELEQENFIQRGLECDSTEMIAKNREFVFEFSDRERNRQKFYDLFNIAFA